MSHQHWPIEDKASPLLGTVVKVERLVYAESEARAAQQKNLDGETDVRVTFADGRTVEIRACGWETEGVSVG